MTIIALDNSKHNNRVYYRAAAAAVREKKYDAALEIINKLSGEYRDQAKPFITYQIAMQAARDQQLEKAEQWARRDDDLARRAYLFTLIADSLLEGKNKDTVRARELLDEVEQTAAKLDKDREKAAVLIGGATVAARFDTVRATDLLRAAIKAANKVANFTGETGIARGLDIGGFYYDYLMYVDEFTFSAALNRLAHANFNETLVDVRELKGRLPRLKAVVALCGGVLSEAPSKKVSS